MDDQTIKADILMRIRRDSRINDGTVDVAVTNGLVVITGTVPSYRKKLALQLKAKKTRGVVSVDNRLRVLYPRELGNPPQAVIKQTAETVLAANADMDAAKVTLEVDSGEITLRGTVKWFWQLHRAEALVSNIIGVVDVKNELTVVPSERVSDEAIAGDIMAELDHSDHVDPGQILVEVDNGTVMLSGAVRSGAAKSDIYDAAGQQPGVRQIIDNLTVTP